MTTDSFAHEFEFARGTLALCFNTQANENTFTLKAHRELKCRVLTISIGIIQEIAIVQIIIILWNHSLQALTFNL